jgi:hypothetical protein
MKPKLVKNPINQAASYTNFVVIDSRAIYSRVLAMPAKMDQHPGLRQATSPEVTID